MTPSGPGAVRGTLTGTNTSPAQRSPLSTARTSTSVPSSGTVASQWRFIRRTATTSAWFGSIGDGGALRGGPVRLRKQNHYDLLLPRPKRFRIWSKGPAAKMQRNS